ncbi:tripartite tricarboxylate transporter TctB family protein [Vogesella sp. LIG4]|uniref:tripartite tricarboxylate transporter TctB family protein n=1 Tax=Vogesella sp. LIG4 TaxID=1192162 RepID=UPI0008201A67|nr:tripartite tricarboxylate transporter TctB family protein [Vogesella sp. LIG4]SCK12414.1 putative tricarboxylic transport membrane protein [Vogesella sp. LIG4]
MIKRVSGEQWLAIGVIVLGIFMAWQIGDIPNDAGYAGIGPRFFPTLIVSGLIVAGGALLMQRRHRNGPDTVLSDGEDDTDALEAEEAAERGDPDWRMFVIASGSLIAHMALIGLIGFTLAGTLLCFGICRALETRRPALDLVLSFALALVLFHLFKWLGLNLPALLPGGVL